MLQSLLHRKDKFISRLDSYHGNTLDALALGGMQDRRLKYENLLNGTHFRKVSRCFYDEDKNEKRLVDILYKRAQKEGSEIPPPTKEEEKYGLSKERYVDALICELEDAFDSAALRDRDGKLIDTVAAFVAEPWVGAVSLLPVPRSVTSERFTGFTDDITNPSRRSGASAP